MSTKAQQAAENLVNGNVRDAKQLARRCRTGHLFTALRDAGHSQHRATLGALYLRGANYLWQEYCDAE